MKTLVTYFSASGATKRVAEKVANALDADIFELLLKLHILQQTWIIWTRQADQLLK